ncbi:MAG TPA: hypothetical protein VFG35_21430 [Actinoplanes sp.]|nr:hypothetical protein [Actinoplanes sp.]
MSGKIRLGSRTRVWVATAAAGLAVAAGFGVVTTHGDPAASGVHATADRAVAENPQDSGEGPNL